MFNRKLRVLKKFNDIYHSAIYGGVFSVAYMRAYLEFLNTSILLPSSFSIIKDEYHLYRRQRTMKVYLKFSISGGDLEAFMRFRHIPFDEKGVQVVLELLKDSLNNVLLKYDGNFEIKGSANFTRMEVNIILSELIK